MNRNFSLLLIVLAVASFIYMIESVSDNSRLSDMRSCECWHLEECPSNCTGKEVQGLLRQHSRLFEDVKLPFVILFPWFEKSRSSFSSEAAQCGEYIGASQIWISLPNRRLVEMRLHRSRSMVDSGGVKILSYQRNAAVMRTEMVANKFDRYHTGKLRDKRTEVKNSFVAVDVCGGIRGVITDGNRSYIIQPLPHSKSGRIPHVIHEAEEPSLARSLTSKTFWMHRLPSIGSQLVNTTRGRWVLNLAVIVDPNLAKKFKWEEDLPFNAGYYVARLVNMAAKAFFGTSVEIRFRTLVVTHPGQLNTNKDIKDTLNNLVLFVSQNVPSWKLQLGWSANATIFLTSEAFEEAVEYLAVPASLCLGPNRTMGVVQVLHTADEYRVSKLIALAIVDMFGINGFPCPIGLSCDSGKVLSLGDRKRLHYTIMSGIAKCLEKSPRRRVFEKEPRNLCGNGFVDRGEECDSATSPCCISSICLAKTGVQCLDSGIGGACCHKCRLRPAGEICRKPASECDLPEMCDGTQGVCPRDLALDDGQPCAAGQAFCYRGLCPTLDAQCQDIWGTTAKAASSECFQTINTQEGHCGDDRKCNRKRDTPCGVLHCQGGASRPLQGDEFWHTTNPSVNRTMECKYLKAKAPKKRRFVSDGTRCGRNRLCKNAQCRPVSDIFHSSCPTRRGNRTCSGRGVCLSAGRCLCRPGWGGIVCEKRVDLASDSTALLVLRLQWKHLDSSGMGLKNVSTLPNDDNLGIYGGTIGPLNTITLIVILCCVVGGGAFVLIIVFMVCYRRRSSLRQHSGINGNGEVIWNNKRTGYALPKDQLHMEYTDGVERRKRKRKRRGRQRRNSRGKIIGSRYGEGDYVDENDSIERIIKFGSMPSYREDKLNKMLDGHQKQVVGCATLETDRVLVPSQFGSSGSDSGPQCRPLGVVDNTGSAICRNHLSAPSSGAAGSPADLYAAMLGSESSVTTSPGRIATPPLAGHCDALAEGRQPEKGILKNKNIGDLQELANLLSDKVRHSLGPPNTAEQPPGNIVDLSPSAAAAPSSFQVRLPPLLPPPHASHNKHPSMLHPPSSHHFWRYSEEKTNAISGSSCTSDEDSSSCSSVSSTGTAVQPPVILCNAGQQTEPVPTDDSDGEEGSCATGGEGMSEPEVDQDFMKEEVKSTEGTCWDSAEEELTDGEELLPRSVLRSAELLEDFSQKIPSTNLLLRSLQQQHQKPHYHDKVPLHHHPLPPVHLTPLSGANIACGMNSVPSHPPSGVGSPLENDREATRRKRQSYTRATESYESLPPTGSSTGE